jgi:acyl carrier protein
MAELTVEIEKAFGIRIGEDVLEVHEYQQLVQYVRRKAAQTT